MASMADAKTKIALILSACVSAQSKDAQPNCSARRHGLTYPHNNPYCRTGTLGVLLP